MPSSHSAKKKQLTKSVKLRGNMPKFFVHVRDYASSKNKRMNCNSIMWFIFNLQRKNKQLEIELNMYILVHAEVMYNRCNLLVLAGHGPT